MAREACLWLKAGASTGPQRRPLVWDEKRGRYTKSALVERVPQVGFHGSDITSLRPGKLSSRAIFALRDDGNVVPVALTPSAAAEATDYDRERARRRNRGLGWIEVGTCPIREAYGGPGFKRSTLLSDECKPGATACAEGDLGVDDTGRPMPPCPHYLAELKARQGARRSENEREREAYATAEEKQLEAMKDGADATRALAAAILAQNAASAAPAPVFAEVPPAEPPKGKPAK